MLIHNANELAQYVRTSRKSEKLSQEDLSSKSLLLQRTISTFENHPGGTKLDTLFRILSAANLQLHVVKKGADLEKEGQWNEQW